MSLADMCGKALAFKFVNTSNYSFSKVARTLREDIAELKEKVVQSE